MFDNIFKKYIVGFLDEKLTVANAQALVNSGLQAVAEFVQGTETTIDDAVLAETEKLVDFNHLAAVITEGARAALGLSPKLFFAGERPVLYLMLMRARMVNSLVKEKGMTRAGARAVVNKASDELILAKSAEQGAAVGALGDGSIIQWIKDHMALIAKIVAVLIPLLLMLAEPQEKN